MATSRMLTATEGMGSRLGTDTLSSGQTDE